MDTPPSSAHLITPSSISMPQAPQKRVDSDKIVIETLADEKKEENGCFRFVKRKLCF
jgi:hypothetical protein